MARAELPSELLWLLPVSPNFPASCNSFAVREDDGTWTWIDPGAAGDANLARTQAELDRLGLALDDLGRILITHPHVDHIGAAAVLRQRGIKVPVLCHPDAVPLATDLDAMMASFDFDLALARFPDERDRMKTLVDGLKRIIFHSGAPFVPIAPSPVLFDEKTVSTGPFAWECLLTEGHAPGHVMFYSRKKKILIAGDVIGHTLAWHSPSSGGAAGYLTSLQRIAALDVAVVCPAHGDPWDDPPELIERMRRKILAREERLLDALSRGARGYADVYGEVMRDPGKTRVFPLVPMLEGHIQRLTAAGVLREPEGGILERV